MPRTLRTLACIVPALLLAACGSGDPGPAGPAGPAGPGAADEPSVSGIVPNRAFLARKLDVTISGFGTKFDAATTVDFGAGITVDKLTVASPTALVASITIDKFAQAGARDVSVNAGGKASVYKGAFGVESPLKLALHGPVAQGGIVFATAQGKDLGTPFDTTSESGGLLAPPVFVGLKATDNPGMTASISDVQLYTASFTLTIDVTAPAGQKPFSITSGVDAADQVEFPFPEGLNVAARQPTPLTSGTAASASFTNGYDTTLYSFTPPAGPTAVDFTLTGTAQGASPRLVVLPKSGKFNDLISAGTSSLLATAAADPYYLIAFDPSGTKGYQVQVKAVATAATAAAEAANNNTSGTAQVASSLPFILQNATLSDANDEDWIAITAAAGDVGKKIRVVTSGDPKTDTLVEVFRSDGTTTLGGPSGDFDYPEDHLSAAIPAAGTYYVKISAGSGYAATNTSYGALIRIQ